MTASLYLWLFTLLAFWYASEPPVSAGSIAVTVYNDGAQQTPTAETAHQIVRECERIVGRINDAWRGLDIRGPGDDRPRTSTVWRREGITIEIRYAGTRTFDVDVTGPYDSIRARTLLVRLSPNSNTDRVLLLSDQYNAVFLTDQLIGDIQRRLQL